MSRYICSACDSKGVLTHSKRELRCLACDSIMCYYPRCLNTVSENEIYCTENHFIFQIRAAKNRAEKKEIFMNRDGKMFAKL